MDRAMLIRVLLLLLLTCGWTGCGPSDETRTYTVPKAADLPALTQPIVEMTGDYQIIGGLFPKDDPAWFFKFGGKVSDLANYTADFEKMMASVRFPNGLKQPPVWDTPAGWQKGEGRGDIVLATVYPDPKNKKLEISLSSSRGGVFGNLKRWAGQVGHENFAESQLDQISKPVTAEKVTGLLVDIRGPKAPPPPGGGPMMGGKPPAK
jgi:hypothetical protein